RCLCIVDIVETSAHPSSREGLHAQDDAGASPAGHGAALPYHDGITGEEIPDTDGLADVGHVDGTFGQRSDGGYASLRLWHRRGARPRYNSDAMRHNRRVTELAYALLAFAGLRCEDQATAAPASEAHRATLRNVRQNAAR
ncbi:MAG TPA: hypothetical protein VF116_20940, partial [Ktedonobacterales bacterium]